MTAPLLEQLHRNHGLFSDHYLNVTLRQHPSWQRLAEDASSVMEQLKATFETYNPVPASL
jgi:hypothetical protein